MRIFKDKQRHEEGFTLLESLIALAILGFAIVAIVAALTTGTRATLIHSEQAVAESLARTQLEYVIGVKDYQFATPDGTNPYPPNPSLDSTELTSGGWDLITNVTAVPGASTDDGLQRIIVNVIRNGKQILTIATYKADVN